MLLLFRDIMLMLFLFPEAVTRRPDVTPTIKEERFHEFMLMLFFGFCIWDSKLPRLGGLGVL